MAQIKARTRSLMVSPFAKITRAFALLRSALMADPPPDRLPTVFADSESRACVISPRDGARSLFLTLLEGGDQWAHGETLDLAMAERITRRWLEDGAQPTELAREFDVVEADDPYLLEDEYVEGVWRSFLSARFDNSFRTQFHWDELPHLVRLAAERPELRRLVPYTSAWWFGVSRRKVPPDNLPLITPLGNGRYSLGHRWGGEALGEGDATDLLDMLARFSARKAPAKDRAADVLDIFARSSGAEALAEGDAAHVLDALVTYIQQNPRRPNRSVRP